MACAQVMGNDVTLNIAGMSGNFELNVFMPVIGFAVLQSCRLLAEGCDSFRENCAAGIEPNRERLRQNLEGSLMLVTALNPHIGYEKSAAIALKAHREHLSLRDAAIQSGHLTAEQFAEWVRPEKMARPHGGA